MALLLSDESNRVVDVRGVRDSALGCGFDLALLRRDLAAGTGAQVGRQITVTDAQIAQVGKDGGSIAKGEVAVQLQPVGRGRDG